MAIPLETSGESSSVIIETPRRHALGLPAGSVRALLALAVLGLMWALVLRYDNADTPVSQRLLPLPFVYLQFLMVLILAHFFSAHGKTIGPVVSRRSPLGLPRGTVRFLLLAGYLGMAGYLYQTQPNFEFPTSGGPFILLMGLLVTGYILGHLSSGIMRIVGRGRLPDWFQDFEAWVALIAMFLMGVLLIVFLVINPSVPEQSKLDMPTTQAWLAGVVGFYFGARS
jgi:hypothetical protein